MAAAAPAIAQSPNDPRQYRALQLPNGLRAILVADLSRRPRAAGGGKHGATMAAAAVAVGVGSYAEPAAIGGLAHLCEHMLFMGSSSHPSEKNFGDDGEEKRRERATLTHTSGKGETVGGEDVSREGALVVVVENVHKPPEP